MTKFDKALAALRNNPDNSKFEDLRTVCLHVFGRWSQKGGSHLVFTTGVADDPRVVIQARGNMAKGYQVKQVLRLIDSTGRLETND